MTSVMGFDRLSRQKTCGERPTFFNPRNLVERRPKRLSKLKLTEKMHGIRPSKQSNSPRLTTFRKHLHVFEYMGKDSPRSFTRSDRKILLSGIMEPISTGADENDVREEILEEADIPGFSLIISEATDFQFIQVSGKTASVPHVREGFTWTGDAVKSLAGQGAVYVRLTKDFSVVSVSDPGSASADDLIEVSLVSPEYYLSLMANWIGRFISLEYRSLFDWSHLDLVYAALGSTTLVTSALGHLQPDPSGLEPDVA